MISEPVRVLVVAPHPDDETLGCGGSILKFRSRGIKVHWLIVTSAESLDGFDEQKLAARDLEIEAVSKDYTFEHVHQLGFPSARLDTLGKSVLVDSFANVLRDVQPDRVYIPYRNDAHSDHAEVFDAAVSACKSFRANFLSSLYVYETLSETEFGLRTDDPGFRPNLFEDIEGYLERKIEVMSRYASEMGEFPFPRSRKAIEALAALRGAQSGFMAAEAFMILKEVRR